MTTDASNATDYSGNSLAESLGDGTPSTNIRKLLDSVQSESCMVLYNDTLHGREVHCDNLWVITTHQLTQIRSAFDALAELDPLDVYEKTIEIEKHWKQRAEQAEAERDRLLADNKARREALELIARGDIDRGAQMREIARAALLRAKS